MNAFGRHIASDTVNALAGRMPPSITMWWRLEPSSREEDMGRALQAQVRDPWWALARQWQVGEYLADDSGSPIVGAVRTESLALSSYRPGTQGAVQQFSEALPLETHVEREPVTLGLRAAIQLGSRLEALLVQTGAAQATIERFRQAYPIAPDSPAGEDLEGQRVRILAAGRCLDGLALLATARAHAADAAQTPPIPALGSGEAEKAATAVQQLLGYRDSLYSEPEGDSAWSSRQLEYDFAVGAESQSEQVPLEAPGFRGGQLDWYDFSIGSSAIGSSGQSAVVRDQTFIPTKVSFRGMAKARWWDFEQARIDLGSLEVDQVDLAKLLVMEFVLIYGGDWLQLPLPLAIGEVSRVDSLIVTDTFGQRTLISPTGEQGPAGERPWSMFSLTGEPAGQDLLLLAPTVSAPLDGPDLEEVLFVRDEMAEMGWGIERTIQGSLDAPVNGYEAYLQRLAANPPPPARTLVPGGPQIQYLVGTTVPDNWIPLVPVKTGERSYIFRRGVMGSPTGTAPPTARGQILEPSHPYYVTDEAIPRAGVQVSRCFRRTRWIDGSTVVWSARRVRVGKGEGSSGLAFDVIEPLAR